MSNKYVEFNKILSIVEMYNGNNDSINKIIDAVVDKTKKCGIDCLNRFRVPLLYTHPEIENIHLLKYILIKYYKKERIGLPFWISSWRSRNSIFESGYRFILLKARMKNKISFKEFQKRMNDHLNLQEIQPSVYFIHDTTDVVYMYIHYTDSEKIRYYEISRTKNETYSKNRDVHRYEIQ